jgi:hypothetical protein
MKEKQGEERNFATVATEKQRRREGVCSFFSREK